MKKAIQYTRRTKKLPKTKKLPASVHHYAEAVNGYTFEKNGLELFTYKFAPGQWFIVDPLTGQSLGGAWNTRAKALEYGANELRCSKLAEFRKKPEYARMVQEFEELKEACA